MRILILSDRIPPENKGGAEKVAWALARGLRENGHEVWTISATEQADFEALRDGVMTYHLHTQFNPRWQAYYSLYNPQTSAKIDTLYAQLQPDVVSAFNIHSELSYQALRLAQKRNIPTVYNPQDVMPFAYSKLTHYLSPNKCDYHESDYRLPFLHNLRTMRLRFNPWRNWGIRRIVNATTVKIAGSEVHRQTLSANGLNGFRVQYASVNPSDFEASSQAIEALRTRLALHGRKVILFAGRLTRDKGSEQMLSALEKVIQHVPNALLLTLTRATAEQQGLTAERWRGLADSVRVEGWLEGEALAAAYHACDVVAVPSLCMDTFPTVNLEAMAVKKPVIATCFGGSSEAIVHGETGFIVNPFDIDLFAQRLTQILSDDTLAKRMGEAGHARLMQRFTVAHHVKNYESVYQEAIKTRA